MISLIMNTDNDKKMNFTDNKINELLIISLKKINVEIELVFRI